MNNNNHIKNKILEFKDILLISKKYWIIYLLFITLTCLSTVSKNNLFHPKFELLTFVFVSILGTICIIYYFMHDSEKELYKTSFIIILCFGILCSLIVPICDVSDEVEHLTKAEITSRGYLVPHWTGEDKGLTSLVYSENGHKKIYNNIGYETIESINFFYKNREITVFQTNQDTEKINKSLIIFTEKPGAFEQNPTYAYLPQTFGVLIAKLFDLNVIWMLWLARICNLVCYAILISLAIKKTPYLKIPLLVVACIPITIYQAASVSIDSMILGLGILTISYFIYMYKTDDLDTKNIIIFTILCLFLGLCKLTYLAFIFLLLFVPKENFNKNKKLIFYILLSILFVSINGLIWSNYATPTLLHSWRAYNYPNSTEQINFLINNPYSIKHLLTSMFTRDLIYIIMGFFNFFNGAQTLNYTDHYYFITCILQTFLLIVLFTYPKNTKFNLKTKIGLIGIILLIYIGTGFSQLLTYTAVGGTNLGTSIRYFIPLLALIPIVSPINIFNNKNKNFDKYTIVLIIGFMATLILAFATKYY